MIAPENTCIPDTLLALRKRLRHLWVTKVSEKRMRRKDTSLNSFWGCGVDAVFPEERDASANSRPPTVGRAEGFDMASTAYVA